MAWPKAYEKLKRPDPTIKHTRVSRNHFFTRSCLFLLWTYYYLGVLGQPLVRKQCFVNQSIDMIQCEHIKFNEVALRNFKNQLKSMGFLGKNLPRSVWMEQYPNMLILHNFSTSRTLWRGATVTHKKVPRRNFDAQSDEQNKADLSR